MHKPALAKASPTAGGVKSMPPVRWRFAAGVSKELAMYISRPTINNSSESVTLERNTRPAVQQQNIEHAKRSITEETHGHGWSVSNITRNNSQISTNLFINLNECSQNTFQDGSLTSVQWVRCTTNRSMDSYPSMQNWKDRTPTHMPLDGHTVTDPEPDSKES
eukprot:5409411-Amphidinium_carterae.1